MSRPSDLPAPCPGCGLRAAPADGPTHAYIGASPGCWAAYTTLGATGFLAPPQLAVDAYAAQHPGVPERRAVQSVGVHLVSLCATLERGWPPGPGLLRRAADHPPGWRWLDHTTPVGTITVADVLAGEDPAARGDLVRAWARDVWAAWAPHHATVDAWLDKILTGPGR